MPPTWSTRIFIGWIQCSLPGLGALFRGLLLTRPCGALQPDMNDGSKVKCSLRSTGEEDSTVISSAYGGGGHKNASSFILDATEFESWRA